MGQQFISKYIILFCALLNVNTNYQNPKVQVPVRLGCKNHKMDTNGSKVML